MTEDIPNRQTNAAGGKYYLHPLTQERFDSVTTVLDLVDKAALKQWAANLATDYVLENIGAIINAQIEPPCGNTNNRCHLKHGRQNHCERCPCGRCGDCWRRRATYRHSYESHRRAEEGHEVHQAINSWVLLGGQHIAISIEAQPYFATFLDWAADFGLTPRTEKGGSWEQTEVTLLNREHKYAGTSDGAIWLVRGQGRRAEEIDAILDRLGLDRALIRVDYKTREKPDERLFMDMPLQGAAYEACTVAMLPDGQEFEAPRTHARYVLQLRKDPDEKTGLCYTFKPMQSSGTFEAFLGILTAYRWREQHFKTAFDLDAVLPYPCKHPFDARSTLRDGSIVCTRCQTTVIQTVDVLANLIDTALDGVAEQMAAEPLVPVDLAQVGSDAASEILGLDDPWAELADPAPPPPAPPPPPPEPAKPAKKATKRAAKKAAPAAAPATSATMDSLRTFDPGKPHQSALAEEIPF